MPNFNFELIILSCLFYHKTSGFLNFNTYIKYYVMCYDMIRLKGIMN